MSTDIDRALAAVPREPFAVGPVGRSDASAPDIGCGQRGTPPDTVRRMALEVGVVPGSRVLELGSGSGFTAAVLAALGARVDGVEREAELVARARRALTELGLDARIHHGDGGLGWPGGAPYDAILATYAVRTVPGAWLRQLSPSGVLLVPIGPGDGRQELTRFHREGGQLHRQGRGPACFTPGL